MKGKILDYNFQESKGLISGDDGNRYSFENAQWKADSSPKVNQTVDFVIDGDTAKDIYLVKTQINDIVASLNIEGSEARKGAVFAAIGSGLMFLTIVPFLGVLFAIAGVVLEILGVKKLSDNAQNEKDIFKNFIWGIIAIVIGSLVFGIVVGVATFGSILSMDDNLNFGAGAGVGIFSMVVGILVYLAFAIFGVIKMYKSLNSIGAEYNVPLMQLVAKGYIAGIVLVPLFGIGYLILFAVYVAKIFAYLKIEK